MKEIETTYENVRVGQDITCWLMPRGQSGQGGIVVGYNDQNIVLESGTAKIENLIWRRDVHHITTEIPFDADECLDYNPETCDGPVDLHWSGGMNGRSWPRCRHHADLRDYHYEHSMERYADSDCVPDWFDPDAIGERWEADY